LSRRIGKEDSETRTALMNAVETIMCRDGYAALSARSIARCAGLNYQLVFYYFEKVENLFLATYRRRTQRLLGQIEQALDSERPLHALWSASSDPVEAGLALEYMAMANHSPAIRSETIEHVERTVGLVSERMAKRLTYNNPDPKVFTPAAVSMIVQMIGSNLGSQSVLGIAGGLGEARTLVEWLLEQMEPSQPNA